MHSHSFTVFSNKKTKMPSSDETSMKYLSIVRSSGVASLQILLYCYLSMGFYNAVFTMAQDYRITQRIIG